MFSQIAVILLASATLIVAHPVSSPTASEQRRGTMFGGNWAHSDDHPAVALFKRQNASSAAVGSPAWSAQYPTGTPDPTKMPAAWQAALAAAESAGLIPKIPQSNSGRYPSGTNPVSTEVCSSTYECRAPDDIWDAPDGMLGVSFDDGPTTFSPQLYDFLKTNNQRATHFFIGNNVLRNWQNGIAAFQLGDDLAVHTYSHRYMTSLSNAEIVAELGYTMQIIADITGGRVPKYWRPSYGDSDNRVRAIAKGIFGLIQVNWNQDTDDWELGSGKVTQKSIAAEMNKWLTGPKSPGLMILEHELSTGAIDAFISAYPLMKSNGWDTRSVPDLFNAPWYANSANDNAPVTPLEVIKAGSANLNLTVSSTISAASSTITASTFSVPTLGASPVSASRNSAASSRQGFELTTPLLIAILSFAILFA